MCVPLLSIIHQASFNQFCWLPASGSKIDFIHGVTWFHCPFKICSCSLQVDLLVSCQNCCQHLVFLFLMLVSLELAQKVMPLDKTRRDLIYLFSHVIFYPRAFTQLKLLRAFSFYSPKVEFHSLFIFFPLSKKIIFTVFLLHTNMKTFGQPLLSLLGPLTLLI